MNFPYICKELYHLASSHIVFILINIKIYHLYLYQLYIYNVYNEGINEGHVN